MRERTDSTSGGREKKNTDKQERATASVAVSTTPPPCTTLMASATACGKPRPAGAPIIGSVVPLLLLLLVSSSSPAAFVSAKNNSTRAVFRPREELLAYRRIMARMARMEKASNKTIQVLPFRCLFFFLPAPFVFVLYELSLVAVWLVLHAESRR
jgi:hypothetical protein